MGWGCSSNVLSPKNELTFQECAAPPPSHPPPLIKLLKRLGLPSQEEDLPPSPGEQAVLDIDRSDAKRALARDALTRYKAFSLRDEISE